MMHKCKCWNCERETVGDTMSCIKCVQDSQERIRLQERQRIIKQIEEYRSETCYRKNMGTARGKCREDDDLSRCPECSILLGFKSSIQEQEAFK